MCSVPQSLCSLSGLLLEALFSLLFSPSVSPPPRNSTLRRCCNREHTHTFFPSDPVSMYSLGVHLHTTHYVTSSPPPLSFFTPTHYKPRKEHTAQISLDIMLSHTDALNCTEILQVKRGIPNIIRTKSCLLIYYETSRLIQVLFSPIL